MDVRISHLVEQLNVVKLILHYSILLTTRRALQHIKTIRVTGIILSFAIHKLPPRLSLWLHTRGTSAVSHTARMTRDMVPSQFHLPVLGHKVLTSTQTTQVTAMNTQAAATKVNTARAWTARTCMVRTSTPEVIVSRIIMRNPKLPRLPELDRQGAPTRNQSK